MEQNWALAAYDVHKTTGETFRITVKGRDRWALESLLRAGRNGCTPINHPGPRWSAYVFNLRGAGIEIETITETHEGDFKGHHARYICRSTVTPFRLAGQEGAAARLDPKQDTRSREAIKTTQLIKRLQPFVLGEAGPHG